MRIATLLLAVVPALAAPVPKVVKAKPDAERFAGTWDALDAGKDGKPKPGGGYQWTFDADLTMWSKSTGASDKGTQWAIQIDPEKSPKEIDLTHFGTAYKGIYEFDGDDIRIAYATQRPAGFDASQGVYHTLLRRVADKGK